MRLYIPVNLRICSTCGKPTSKYAKKCSVCEYSSRRGSNNSNWKGGLKSSKSSCVDCGAIISRFAKRCHPCATAVVKLDNLSKTKTFRLPVHCLDCGVLVKYGPRCRDCGHKVGGSKTRKVRVYKPKEYPREFNEIKTFVRFYDNYICQCCGLTEIENLIKFNANFDVHHIDYDKKNCEYNNLVTLCHSCHMKTNTNRAYWQEYFTNKGFAHRDYTRTILELLSTSR